ncbi:phage tail protein [Roseicyclus marinus]|uniref:phage tail protein n=1 Tax=Roseicyclus marinus TaxID=2161673 RepID=UPI00240EEBD3|nr:tail fiber protein [Roseicyclus marinus]MDG3040597.1 tail fiber protein [Roseicyclus marinus]
MAEPFIGQAYLVAYDFPTRGFALCDGALMSIASAQSLYSLIGTTYGGNGTTNFALPDLRGRVPVGQGAAPGASTYKLGQRAGSEATTLTPGNMPAHTHSATLMAENGGATTTDPTGNLLAQGNIYLQPGRSPDVAMASSAIQIASAGGSLPVNNMQPYLVMNYQIALVGLFPSRH